MADTVLDDLSLLQLSKKVNIVEVPPGDFSVFLGFSDAEGANAQVAGNIAGSPQQAIRSLLNQWVNKHGTRANAAQALLIIFKENGMTKAAEHLETTMIKKGVPLLQEPPPTLPSPPSIAPGERPEELEASVTRTPVQDENMDTGS